MPSNNQLPTSDGSVLTSGTRSAPANARRGNTLIEVMVSCVLASALLVPSISLLIDAVRWSDRVETRKEMLLLADSLMSSIQFQLAQDFQPGDRKGDFAQQGYPEILYTASWRADNTIDSSGNWMSIGIQLWWDKDRNGTASAKEAQHRIHSAAARRT